METLLRHIDAPKSYQVVLTKDRQKIEIFGNYAKLLENGAIVIFDGSDHVVATFSEGEIAGMIAKPVQMVTVDTREVA